MAAVLAVAVAVAVPSVVGERAERRGDLRAVRREVGQHVEGRADRRHRDEVGRRSSVSSTYFLAESTARCTSSGCIELTSKSSVISRRPASMSDVIGTGASQPCVAAGGRR